MRELARGIPLERFPLDEQSARELDNVDDRSGA